MPLKYKLQIVALVIVGLTGVYLVFTSDRIHVEPYSLVLSLIVGGFILYLYLLYFRHNK